MDFGAHMYRDPLNIYLGQERPGQSVHTSTLAVLPNTFPQNLYKSDSYRQCMRILAAPPLYQ